MKIYQHLWDITKAVLTGKYVALNTYNRKEEKAKVNHLSSYLKKLEKRRANYTQIKRMKEITKSRNQ